MFPASSHPSPERPAHERGGTSAKGQHFPMGVMSIRGNNPEVSTPTHRHPHSSPLFLGWGIAQGSLCDADVTHGVDQMSPFKPHTRAALDPFQPNGIALWVTMQAKDLRASLLPDRCFLLATEEKVLSVHMQNCSPLKEAHGETKVILRQRCGFTKAVSRWKEVIAFPCL